MAILESRATSARMKAILLALLPSLTGLPSLPASHPFQIRASSAADDLLSAIEAEGIPEADRATWTRRAWVWAFFESAYVTDALGDAGKSCGVMQVTSTGLALLKGATCDSVRKNRVDGFRVGLRTMKHLIDKCGSVESGLGAYATNGECKKGTIGLVVRRMKLAGEWDKP